MVELLRVVQAFFIGVLKVLDAFADAFAQFGQATGAEDQDDDEENDQQLGQAEGTNEGKHVAILAPYPGTGLAPVSVVILDAYTC